MVQKNRIPIISKEEAGDLPVLKLNSGAFREFSIRIIEDKDIQTEEDLQLIILFLYNEPECPCYYFKKRESLVNELLSGAENRGDILMDEYALSFYKHPKSEHAHDYIEITPHDGKYKFDWEREVVEKGPMYVRVKLQLSEKKKRELEIWQKIELEELYRRKKLIQNKFDIFLSYSSKNQEEANRIYAALKKAGGKVFLAQKDLAPG